MLDTYYAREHITAPNASTATSANAPAWPAAPRWARARAAPSFGGLGDQLDLDAGAERQLGDAVGAARMRAALGEDFAEQLGAAVGDQVVLDEIGACC